MCQGPWGFHSGGPAWPLASSALPFLDGGKGMKAGEGGGGWGQGPRAAVPADGRPPHPPPPP